MTVCWNERRGLGGGGAGGGHTMGGGGLRRGDAAPYMGPIACLPQVLQKNRHRLGVRQAMFASQKAKQRLAPSPEDSGFLFRIRLLYGYYGIGALIIRIGFL